MNIKEVARGLSAAIVSLLFFIVLLEVSLQIYTRMFIYYDVEMSRYAAEVKEKSANPKIGHVHKPNSEAYLMGTDVVINSDGLRDREYPVARNDKYRIAVLGDSLTFAWGVDKEDAFEEVLEREISKKHPVEMINFGTGNYNTQQQLNLFKEKGLKYNPDKVVVFYFINDAELTPERSKWNALAWSRGITFFWSRVRGLMSRMGDSSETFESFYAGLYEDDQPGFLATRESFLELKEICAERNIQLQVILLPELHNLVDYPFVEQYKKVSDFLAANSIDAIDLTADFQGYENPQELWVAPDDAHPNALAHGMIAEYSQAFVEQGIINNE
ncbi:MAG: SGNH/GDSL hydrolase family protein [Gammaproteobacteria bacterium]